MPSQLQHPWQNGPTELISYAITRLHANTDLDRRLAFLLLDVGIETLFKTYLTLPTKVTNAQGSFTERKKAAEGNFHELVDGIEKAAQPHIVSFNLSHIQYCHDLRNKLYHQGNGITVPLQQVYEYANLSVQLLMALLGVDLRTLLLQPQLEAEERKHAQLKLEAEEREIESQVIAIDKTRKRLEMLVRNAVEKLSYVLVLPSFESYFNQLAEKMGYGYGDPVWQEEFLNELLDYIANDLKLAELVDVIDISPFGLDNITDFYLNLLGCIIPDLDQIGIYNISFHYPEQSKRTRFKIVGGDIKEQILEQSEPSFADVINDGTDLIISLEDQCKIIEDWTRERA